MLFCSALIIPFIGMAAGANDAFITIYARPFARPVGKLFAETFGFYRGHYFTYMDSKDTNKNAVQASVNNSPSFAV